MPNPSSQGPFSIRGGAGIAPPVLNYKHDPSPQRHFQENPQTWPRCNMPHIWVAYCVVIAPIFIQGCNLERLSFFSRLSLTNPPVSRRFIGSKKRHIENAKGKQLLGLSVRLSSLHLSTCLIKWKEWLNWPRVLGGANKWALQLAIRPAARLWSDALPDSYGNLCTSPDTLLAELADGGFECEGMDRTAVGFLLDAAKFTLSFIPLSKVYKMFPPTCLTWEFYYSFFPSVSCLLAIAASTLCLVWWVGTSVSTTSVPRRKPYSWLFLQHHKWAAVSDTTGSFAMKCSTDVHGLQKMNPYDVVLWPRAGIPLPLKRLLSFYNICWLLVSFLSLGLEFWSWSWALARVRFGKNYPHHVLVISSSVTFVLVDVRHINRFQIKQPIKYNQSLHVLKPLIKCLKGLMS